MVISKFRIKIEKYINTDYAVTAWMLCVIPHIKEDVFKNSNRNNMIKDNTIIKTLFSGSPDKELYETLDTFWSEYTKFNHKNDPFDSNEILSGSKDICDRNSYLWYHQYSLTSTKLLGVVH